METIAAVITGKASAAICAIAVCGSRAADICRELIGDENLEIARGRYKLCRIVDGCKQIDEVLVGREADEYFVISCHGNPLIVEMITSAIAKRGVKVVTADELTAARLKETRRADTFEVETKLTVSRAFSIEAARLLQNQLTGGLGGFVSRHLDAAKIDVSGIKDECRQILADSDIAEKMLRPLNVVLAGLPNSGKSTLFNRLVGKEAAIVADKRGTTRDWIKGSCQFGPVAVDIMDTAGLDETLWALGAADKQSQEKTASLIENADIVLVVIDICDSDGLGDIERIIARCKSRTDVVKVYNKADKCGENPGGREDGIVISAADEMNVDSVINRIVDITQVKKLSPVAAVCFSPRQRKLIEAVLETDEPAAIRAILERIRF